MRSQVIQVHLRPVTVDNLTECLALRVQDEQIGFVASNAQSLTEASVLPSLVRWRSTRCRLVVTTSQQCR